MEWLDGEDLGARLKSARLELAEALAIARQLAGALAAAHEKGVVHRDVKPSNVFLVDGKLDRVKLVDFGLARPAGAASLTTTGMLIGTPSYMAPEQARGDRELDTRVDVYGLGALLFHCATGRVPFEGDTIDQVIARILGEPAPRLGARIAGVSPGLDELVSRMLSKDPLRRPADGRAMHAALVGVDQPAVPAAAGLDDTQFPAAPSLTLDAGAGVSTAMASSSIAVLSFLDMSPDRDQGYLCDGIADELIDALTQIDGLRVAARISSFWFKSAVADAREIGTRIGVDAILEGGVRLAGKRLRVTVQLVDVATGYQRWSHRFDGTLDDVFAIQDEIALRVVTALRGMLSSRDQEVMRRPGANVEAYGFYLRGRQLLHSVSPASYRTAVDMFQTARLSSTRATRRPMPASPRMHCRYFEWSYGEDDVRAAADHASARALETGPQLPGSHVARAQVHKVFRRYDEARAELDEAIRISPNDFDAHHLYGRLYFEMGDLEGIREAVSPRLGAAGGGLPDPTVARAIAPPARPPRRGSAGASRGYRSRRASARAVAQRSARARARRRRARSRRCVGTRARLGGARRGGCAGRSGRLVQRRLYVRGAADDRRGARVARQDVRAGHGCTRLGRARSRLRLRSRRPAVRGARRQADLRRYSASPRARSAP